MLKLDLVMWTKNGEITLPAVLERINSVVPSDAVNQRLIVDDASTDSTRTIAERFGWFAVSNQGHGVSDGANTALKHVETDCFASFEQDLYLSKDWFNKIVPRVAGGKYAVASGMRFADAPVPLRKLEQYAARKYRGERYLSSWLRRREPVSFNFGKTFDNTVYNTEVLKAIGGFPSVLRNAGVDTALAYKLRRMGLDWYVDYSVQSLHLRHNLRHELEHQFWHGQQQREVWKGVEAFSGDRMPVNAWSVIFRLLISPATGLFVALKMGDARITVVNILTRFYFTWGFLQGNG